MEDLIQNVHTLFEELPSQSPPAYPSNVAKTTPAYTYGSIFLSPELPPKLPQPTTQHHPRLVDGLPTFTQSSFSHAFSSLPEDPAMDSRHIPSPTGLLSPLLGIPSSKTLAEGVETSTQGQVMPDVRGSKAVESLVNSNPAEVVSIPLGSVAEWRLHQSRLPPHPVTLTMLQSPPESVPSSISHYPLSSATSFQTGMGRFSP